MTQNLYDDPDFFARYSAMARSVQGLAGAPEWPALKALLPELGGRRVVDLGCGFGWFCRFAAGEGARLVLGLDVSRRMLARAEAMNADPAIVYRNADLETLELPAASFDLAFSSLAFHYVETLGRLLATLHRSLVPGAMLVFSMEHPIFTAPSDPRWLDIAGGRRVWPLDDYQREGPRITEWLVKGVVKQHRTMGTLLNLVLDAGFTLAHVQEWGPSDAELAAKPELAEERLRPTFLLVAAQRP